eukprot:Platyproteum_vivax@DN6432_c0_g1_i1.p1
MSGEEAVVQSSHLQIELKHLLAVDNTPITTEDQMGLLAVSNCQELVNHILTLPQEQGDEGAMVVLPKLATNFKLPREKPLPQKKAKTRWEKFAEQNRIDKKKRSRLMWSEASQSYMPRWGARSAKKLEKKQQSAVMELKPNETLRSNRVVDMEADRGVTKLKQKRRELRNQTEASDTQLPYGVTNFDVPDRDRKRGTENLMDLSRHAQISTASFGRFDNKVGGEKRVPIVKRRKVKEHQNLADEKTAYKKALSQLTVRQKRAEKEVSKILSNPPKIAKIAKNASKRKKV